MADESKAGPAPGAAPAPPTEGYSLGAPVPANHARLHLNEFRHQHSEAVLNAAVRAASDPAAFLTHYSTGPPPELAAALAGYANVSAECVLVGSGSDEILRAAVDAYAAASGRRVILGVPTYTHFEHFARARGLEIEAYCIGLGTSPEDHRAALEYYAPAMTAGSLVYLGSPNNPTGDVWEPQVVEELARTYPASTFLVDEAYGEFRGARAFLESVNGTTVLLGRGTFSPGDSLEQIDNTRRRAMLKLLEKSSSAIMCDRKESVSWEASQHSNILMVRTLSKAFGLAAQRVGYAIGTPATLSRLRPHLNPKAFSAAAGGIALAALASKDHYWARALETQAENARAVWQLKSGGWSAWHTPGNFFLVYVGGVAAATAALEHLGLHVRTRDDQPGLAGFVRVTAGTRGDTEALLEAFGRLAPPPPPPQRLHTKKGAVAGVKCLVRAALEVTRLAGVELWAQSGTMLGMYRHRTALFGGGMIPADDDADLAYLRPPGADGPGDPLAGLVASFIARGYTLQRNRTDAYWQLGTNAPGATISPVHIDIFSYTRSEADGRYYLDDERFRAEDPGSAEGHCNTAYSHDELFPLSQDYRFYDQVIPMPAKSGEVLARALGADFMTVARTRAPGGLVEYAIRDFSPA